jgi:hypothetical protein
MPKLFQVTEEKLAGQIGVSRDRLRALREAHLLLGTHFQKSGGAIVYTEVGIDAAIALIAEKTRQEMELERSVEPEAPAVVSAPAPVVEPTKEPVLELLRIIKTYRNPTWVEALTEGGVTVDCKVRSNIGMRRGTRLSKCEKQPDGRYICRGRF